MKFSEFYRLLESRGWIRKEIGRHPSHEIPKGTLEKMKKDAGIKD